jgi:ATP-dependent RNA helicase RhlE
MSNTTLIKDTVFSDLGLSPKLLTVINHLKITHPTPIQHKAIPVAIQGKDIIGIAQTGTGKTLAFTLPLIQQIIATQKQGLIILPTRELALQIDEVFKNFSNSFGLKRAVLIGGSHMGKQISDLRRHPQIIIGTPGRINDHIQSKTLNLQKVGILVLDEADRMLDMGFEPQIKQILQHVPKNRQTMLFSATMPPGIIKIASTYMAMPVRIEVARAGTVAQGVNQELFIVRNNQKNQLLNRLLNDYKGTVLVFSRTKYGAKRICKTVQQMGHTSAEIHSNLSLSQRRKSLAGFKSGKYRVLVATDIAARGIDVTDITLVINYDLPDNLDDYIHRIGRTGRAGKIGQAISFIMPDQRQKVPIMERLVRQQLRVSPLPQLPNALPLPAYTPRFNQPIRHSRPKRNSSNTWRQNRPNSQRKVRVHQ